MINFFKKITESVRKFFIKMISYTLQIVGITIILLIAFLIIIAALLITMIKKELSRQKYKNTTIGADKYVYSQASQREKDKKFYS